ncbi:MAG TPA: M24 family metallopeptidase, partial [Acidimicrobiales bacterium]
IDLLVVGREANARYVSGAPRLWMAGSRAVGPGCVLVRATGAVHLLSTWDEGIPEEIPHENLYGISFNSMNFLKVLSGIEGAATARTVGTDSMSGSSAQLLPKAFPSAELVDGEPLLRRVRRVKAPEEIQAIRASVRVAEGALAAAWAAVAPGLTERQLTGVFMEAMAAEGVTTPAGQDVAWRTSRERPWRRANRDVPVEPGDLVAFEAGVLVGGYVGELGRTRVVGEGAIDGDLLRQRDELWERLVAVCRPGERLSGLLQAYESAGLLPPPMPVARGLGLGFDLPLVTRARPREAADQRAEAGMVLALTAFVWKEGVGAVYGQEPVAITATGPELLSTTPFRDPRSPAP